MMDPKSWSLTLGALAAVLAVVLSQGGTPPAATGQEGAAPAVATETTVPPEAPPAEPEPEERWCDQVRLLEDFLALPVLAPVSPSDGDAKKSPACVRWPLPSLVTSASELGYRIDVLVALMPDPLDAGMAYRADEALAAIQSGFAGAGYLFDRFWLPWTGDAAASRLYRRTPGALLFRGKGTLLLVLLVGETPRAGVHRSAFLEALSLAAELRRTARASGPLRILGPSFSGTTESLRIAFHRWMKPVTAPAPDQILLVTGSATGSGLEGLFQREFSGAVRLERAIKPDDELTGKTFWFLVNRMGWNLRDVAILSELDTSYGQSFSRYFKAGDSDGSGGPFLVQFPSNLAQIRTAREKKRAQEKKAEQEEIVDPSHRPLELSLADEDGVPSDVIPQLSPLSATADDMAFANRLQALCKKGVRYVGILATDIRDRLFLAEQVRGLCPDAFLFTFDNHLLDAHPQLTRAMQGSLVLTSFPLFVEERETESGGRSIHQSTSEFREGLFRAVRRLLEDPTELRPQQEPVRSWVVAVGKEDLWPIAGLDENQGASRFTIAGTEGVAFKWITASAVIALLAFWLWRTARPVQLLDGGFWMTHGGIPGIRFFPLAAIGTLILACGVLLVFYSLPLWNRDEFRTDFLSGRVLSWGTNLVVLAAVYTALVTGCAWLLRSASRRRFGFWQKLAWAAGAVLLLLVLRKALLALWILPGGEEFFYARAGDFASGLSPLVSLAFLLAAVFSWALLGIRRRRMSLLQEVSWPLSPALADEPLATGGRLAAEVDHMLWSWFPGRWFWAAVAAAILLPARRLSGIQPIAEPAAYGWVFLVLVGLGFVLGAITFYRFVLLWWKLESVLELLCHTWLLGAFRAEGNAAFYDWKPLRSFGWRMPRHALSLLSAQALRTLTRRGVLGADGAALAPAGALDHGIGTVFQAERKGELETEIRARHELQKWFAKSAYTLERARPALPVDQEEVAREIDRFLSLRVVGWIRYVFGHLRYGLISALTCALFILVGTSVYAFQPKRYLSFGIWALLLAGSLLTLRIFVRMDRNAVLSAIGGTDAGKVSFDRTFFSNLFTYFGIPVLGVVLTQFPAVGSILGEWLQPLLRLLTGS